ncbi:MAG: LytTR family transcriptional regulator [Clostridiaceae bacterium]|nr:LytTR family transcriptional regulator [Clostridiaceae bacterium]
MITNNIRKIPALDGEDIILLNPSDVLFLYFQNRNVMVVTKQKEYRTRHSLNYWEEKLARLDFFRCYRSYLVNLNKVERISVIFRNSYFLKIAGHKEYIPVSRKNALFIKEMLDLG